jgi:hypothetical protein
MFAAKRLELEGKKLATEWGHVYLEWATKCLKAGDTKRARRIAEDGTRRTIGPFYIAVRDQLDDLLELIQVAERL